MAPLVPEPVEGRMHDDQVDVPDAAVRRLVREQFPDWASLPMPRLAAAGTVNAIFRVGEGLTARFPLRRGDADEAGRMLRREAAALDRVADVATVAAPRPVAIGAPGEGYSMPWSVQTWVPGDDATSESVAASEAVASDAAELIRAFRAVPTGGAPFHGRGRGGVLAAHDDRVAGWLAHAAGLVDVDAAGRLWQRLRTEPAPGALAMTHGDLTPPNLLVRDGRLVGVLDGGGFGPADPALDLVVAWHAFDRPARDVLRAELGVEDAEWRRGAGWALEQAIGLVAYYDRSNPTMAALGRSTIARLVADPSLTP